jgi:hypothetical protein
VGGWVGGVVVFFQKYNFFKTPTISPKKNIHAFDWKKVTTPSTQTHSICTSFLSCMKTLTFKNLYENMGSCIVVFGEKKEHTKNFFVL